MQLDDSMPLAAMTIGQAKEMIGNLISAELGRISVPKAPKQPDIMNINDALLFLKENGKPMTRKSLYSKTFHKTIPFMRIGRTLAFSRKQLIDYIESNTVIPNSSKADAALTLAASARKK